MIPKWTTCAALQADPTSNGRPPITAVLVLLVFASSCSSYLEATRPEYKDPSVIHVGAQRSDIIASLGTPVDSYKTGDSDVDVFKLDPNGRKPGTKVAVGAVNVTADILTLGLWEAVATPVELATQHKLTDYIVTYNNNDIVQSVNIVTK